MALNLTDEQKRLTSGVNPDVVSNGFSKAMRNNDVESWEEGDTFTLPTSLDGRVLKHFPNPEDKENYYEYMLVEVTSKTGKKKIMQFYPSCTTKSAFAIEVDADGKPTEAGAKGKYVEIVKAGGNVTACMKQYASVNDGMTVLLGCTIEIREIKKPLIVSKYGAHANEPWPTTVLKDIHCDALDESGNKK